MKVTEGKPTDFIPDSRNANRGTQRGQKMIQDSLREDGVGRGIVVDKNGNVVAGNKTLENAVDIGIDKVIVVETTGKELVVTKRLDWDLYEDESPRRYAWRDNQSALISIDFDPEMLAEEIAQGIDFGGIFTEDEQDNILQRRPSDYQWENAFGGIPDGGKSPYQQMTFTLHDDQIPFIKEALEISKKQGPFETSNANSNGNALARICELFIGNYGES